MELTYGRLDDVVAPVHPYLRAAPAMESADGRSNNAAGGADGSGRNLASMEPTSGQPDDIKPVILGDRETVAMELTGGQPDDPEPGHRSRAAVGAAMEPTNVRSDDRRVDADNVVLTAAAMEPTNEWSDAWRHHDGPANPIPVSMESAGDRPDDWAQATGRSIPGRAAMEPTYEGRITPFQISTNLYAEKPQWSRPVNSQMIRGPAMNGRSSA